MKTKIPSTAQDALLAEILGDLGEVRDTMKALPVQLMESAHVVAQATEKFSTEFNTIANAEKDNATEELKQAMRKEITLLLRQFTNDAKAKTGVPHSGKIAVWLIAGFLGCVLASCTGVFAAHSLYFDQLADQATLGRRVIAVWQSLPPQSKQMILQGSQIQPDP